MFPIIKKIKRVSPLQAFIVLVVIMGTIFVVKYFGRQPMYRTVKIQVVGKPWTESVVTHYGYKAPFWLSEKVQRGDAEFSVDGKPTAEVIEVEEYQRGGTEVDLYIIAKLKGEINKRTRKFMYASRPIEVGTAMELHLNRVNVVGQIIDDNVPPGGYPQKEMVVTLRARNVEPWIVAKIAKGATMTSGPSGTVVAEILDTKREPALSTVLFTNSSGAKTATFLELNTRVVDVITKVKLTVRYHDGGWYFGGHQQVKVGNQLWLYFPEVNLMGAELQTVEDSLSQ